MIEYKNINFLLNCRAFALLGASNIKSLQNLNHIAGSFIRGGETILLIQHLYEISQR
jgi:hypothetical protein